MDINTQQRATLRTTKQDTPPAKAGDRVTLIAMADPWPMGPHEKGTVMSATRWVDGSWNIGVAWDNGRTLGLVHPEDKFTVTPSEPAGQSLFQHAAAHWFAGEGEIK